MDEFTERTGAMDDRMPALFVGHGSPMNGIEDNEYSRGWRELGERLPRPRAILSISAHWLTEGTRVHFGESPTTIHDFWGFPRELYEVRYGCPGAPALAEEVVSLARSTTVEPDRDWGLDHGSWVPLSRIFPEARIPVVQLSIDLNRPAGFHYGLGRELAPLRGEGVMIIGSGNLVHNLPMASFDPAAGPFAWALEFDELARGLIEAGDHQALIGYENLGTAASLAIPTPDHYWPLLYILALQAEGEPPRFPVTGIAHASVSMRTVLFGM